MRQVTDHATNPVNEALAINVLDEPGHGGACHDYGIIWNQSVNGGGVSGKECRISFQNGPIQEFGVNGITQEALLAIVIDRLRSFQAGAFSCRENALALTKCEEGLMWLKKRTEARAARGVEGKNIV